MSIWVILCLMAFIIMLFIDFDKYVDNITQMIPPVSLK